MNFVSRKVQDSIKVIVSTSLAAVLAVSLPVAAFAQESAGEGTGVIARENRLSQAQNAKATDAAAKEIKPEAKPEAKPAEGKPESATEGGTGIVKIEAPAASATPQTGTTQNPITQPLKLSPDVGTQRVGVNPDQRQLLTLQEAIAMGLQNNLNIESFRQGVKISEFSLFASQGIYDPLLGSNVNYRSQTFPVTSIFQGGNDAASVTQSSLTYNFNTSKNMEKGGGFYQVDFNNTRTNTSSTAATLTTQYNPSITLSFTQPLMRNFKIDANRRNIEVAKKQLDLSDSQFRQQVIEIISSIQRAYWDLYFALENEKIARKSVDLTLRQLSDNQKQVDAGTLAPIELRSTEAALESRKSDVIVAMQGITTAENTLKGLLLKDQNDKMWYSQLFPSDAPNTDDTPKFNLEEATTLALKNRPELEQLRLQVQQKEIDLAFFENQAKPQIDLVGIYGSTGLAGNPSDVVRSTTGGVDPTTLGIINSLNEARAGLGLGAFPVPQVPVITTVLGDSVPERFRGGYFQSLRNLFGQDFRNYQVGVTISFPWKNKIAEANIGRTLAETQQLDARSRAQAQTVQIEVRNALQAVESARKRWEAQRAAAIAADAQLRGEVEKFRAGLSTNFFVLQRQTDLAIAEGNEIRARTDYNKALADLQRATGLTLTVNNVQVNSAVSQNGRN